MLEAQRLRGNATYWQVVQPALRPELGAIDALLAQARPGEPSVCPKGDERRVEEAFLEFWKNSPASLHKILKRRPVKDESQFVRLPEVPYFEDPGDMCHYEEGSSR